VDDLRLVREERRDVVISRLGRKVDESERAFMLERLNGKLNILEKHYLDKHLENAVADLLAEYNNPNWVFP